MNDWPSPRPGILDISPYVGGEAKIAGIDRVIRLASNESALGPSKRALAAYAAAAPGMHRYPDGNSTALRAVLGRHHGLDPARIVCGAGSDELITALIRAYAGPGDEVLYARHGFLMYPIGALAVGATPVTAPETDLTFDVDAILARVTRRTRLVFIANPNNPTGTYISRSEMQRLHAGLPSSVMLVIDAAYSEFVQRNDYEPGVTLVDAGENVVMARTFSKIYALAGLRLGWAYCSPRRRRDQPRAQSLQCQRRGASGRRRRARGCRLGRPRARAQRRLAAMARARARRHGARIEPQRREFRAGAFQAAARCWRRVLVPAIARHPHAQGRGLPPARASAHHHRHRGGDARGRIGGAGLSGVMSDLVFQRVAIIGFGLIGSSLAHVLRRDASAREIVACARTEATLATVKRLGLADDFTLDPAAAVRGADLVVIAAPHSAYAEIAQRIGPALAPGAILTDVGSVKGAAVRDLQPIVPPGVHLVPGHPVAGTEHSGPEAGFAEMFDGRWCILTPPPGTDPAAVDRMIRLWQSAGMKVEIMSAEHHDMVLAMTSHLPHAIAYTIVGTATDLEETLKSEVIKFSAGGFRDFTRIAASDPVMWRDVFLSNREAVLEMLQRFTEDLTALQREIRWGEADKLEDRFRRTREIRRSVIEANQA